MRILKYPRPPTAINLPIKGICNTINVIDPFIIAVSPKSIKKAFLEVYRLIFARHCPKDWPISPAAVTTTKAP
jgi:hypothetical protein